MNIVDEYTREALAMRVGRHCTAEDLVVELDRLVVEHGAPSSLRCDNGPELIAWALRDWCRLHAVGISYIEPGSPWENPYVESFNGRVHDELLNIEEFGSLLEAQVVVEAWRIEYNTYRPHSALGGLTPAEFTRRMDHRTPTSTLMSSWTTKRGPVMVVGPNDGTHIVGTIGAGRLIVRVTSGRTACHSTERGIAYSPAPSSSGVKKLLGSESGRRPW